MTKLSLKMKILAMLGTALLALIVMSTLSLLQERKLIIDARKETLTTAVQTAHSIVAAYKEAADKGAMSVEDAQKAAKEALRLSRYGGAEGKTEYFYIWTMDSRGVMHPIKPEWEGQDMAGKLKDGDGNDLLKQITDALQRSKDGKAYVSARFMRPGEQTLAPKLQYAVRIDGWNWMVGSGLYTDDIDAAVRQALLTDLLVVAIVTLAVGVVGFAVFRSVVRQIGGEPAHAMSVMSEVAQGHLDTAIPPAPAGSLMDGLSQMVASLRRLVVEVRSASDSIATAASEIAQGNNDLAHRTEDTASNLQATASSMEELSSTVRQTSDATQTANQLAASAAQVAARGGDVVSQVVSTMEGINASSGKISDIIGVIDGIAFQTNILALNAAVEAARAGEQGRGFAVVAGEVRTLAQRSAQAAKEIKALINDSVEKVRSGTTLVDSAGSTMTEIVSSVQRVTDIIGEVRAATSEQSQGIAQVSTAMHQLDQMTQQNSALVEESTAAAASLREQAMKLTDVVALFRVQAGEVQRPRPATAPTRAAPPAARPAASAPRTLSTPAAPALQAKPAKAPGAGPDDGDWESF
ncbi:methyl-accepting chemotaxis protein [Diaphorobacter sp. C33]|uniref:Methyl-accepting chemotaxis sensory transducer with Cache sensor n=1 Tax=Diaphorobacter nitroreducens TaxID=164759 RepID=A0AAX1WT33_9BURK|nr:methyl-accepting chemotaxis protein [Diaphorobacter sp. C33]ROR41616.1 methyl-accepting chemotaxis sensory transducer with Cache sensor [Diaphorobacter nitroreducens]WKK88451.1 methyl-accepting chemotaxis protein [Diaphorobacter sp. C33]